MSVGSTDLNEWIETMREAAEATEKSRLEAARLALYDYLREHPDAPLGDLTEALVPTRPFDDTHLSRVLTDELIAKRLHLSAGQKVRAVSIVADNPESPAAAALSVSDTEEKP